jgi:hypothetical protein
VITFFIQQSLGQSKPNIGFCKTKPQSAFDKPSLLHKSVPAFLPGKCRQNRPEREALLPRPYTPPWRE